MAALDADTYVDPLIGEVIANRYQIECRLGEGAMGAVYRARHVKVGRPFAVKILHARLLSDHKVAERFEREAELAGRLRHANVIGVVDIGETQGTRYMVMDYADGPDLATMLSDAPFTPARVLNLSRQLCEGLFHAHEHGLIHRDFKPENVIVEVDNHGHEVPRIVDFGIAILREAGESASAPGRLTTNGLVLGTPHYMAPEQAVADPIDHRIDLFALGIMMYEMLSGKLPFDGTGAEVARANLLLDPPLIGQRVPFLEVDPLLEAMSRRLMSKQRDLRPPTAKAAKELFDLIERDREAAAAALGVPLAPRAPMVTAPMASNAVLRETAEVHRDDVEQPTPSPRSLLVTPPQGPPMVAPKVATASATRTGEAAPLAGSASDFDTDMVPRLEDEGPRKSRAPLFGAIGVMAALGIGTIVILSRGGSTSDGKDGKEPAPKKKDPVAMIGSADTKPVATPTPTVLPPTPTPTPTPTPPTPPPPTPTPTVKPSDPPPKPVTPPPVHKDPVVVAEQHEQHKDPVGVAVPAVAKDPPASHDISAGDLAVLYKSVGDQLAALGATGSDLLGQFSRYNLSTEMKNGPTRRNEVAADLYHLRAEGLKRKKK